MVSQSELSGLSISVALFICKVHLLLHHHHLLHTFTHPRADSYSLLLLEMALCARPLLMLGIERLTEGRRTMFGMAPKMTEVMSASGVLGLAFICASARPLFDGLLLLLPLLVAMCRCPAFGGCTQRKKSFYVQAWEAVLTGVEGVYYVGALPALFARNEPILHERYESLGIGLVAGANCLVLSLLELFSTVDGGRLRSEGVNADDICHRRGSSSVSSSVRSSAEEPVRWRRNARGSHAGRRDKQRPDSANVRYLSWYVVHAEGLHSSLVGVQSLLVCLLLVCFLYTDHWRSHALRLLSNYALLHAVVAFRQRHFGRLRDLVQSLSGCSTTRGHPPDGGNDSLPSR